MSIELTEQQDDELLIPNSELPHVISRRTNLEYVLIPLKEYEAVREILEDEREQRALLVIAARNALERAEEEP